jgi:hypothetical protein
VDFFKGLNIVYAAEPHTNNDPPTPKERLRYEDIGNENLKRGISIAFKKKKQNLPKYFK